MSSRIEIDLFLKNLLRPEIYDDYGPNGLQIEGKKEIKHICFSVSATKQSVENAVALKADALIVHHGLFWKFHGVRTLTGPFAQRVLPLAKNEINLWSYHLPLDGHLEIGNAASLANKLGLINLAPFGLYKMAATGVKGEFSQEISPQQLKQKLEETLKHHVLHSDAEKKSIRTIGIITGGANSQWVEALKENLDAYITGEMSEHDYHESREAGIHMFAGGHHATEQFGIQNLMLKIQNQFPDLTCTYLDSNNPA